MEIINIKEKFDLINGFYDPKIVGELNNQQVRLAKFKGEFKYHKHDHEDEMFMVIQGEIIIDTQEKLVNVKQGEFIIIPKGQVHRPIAEKEAHVMLFVTSENVNTGDKINEFTKEEIERI